MTYRDEPWHKECFVCTSCKVQLAGQHFTSRDDSPYCLKCFGNLYAKKCEACKKPITGNMHGRHFGLKIDTDSGAATFLSGITDVLVLTSCHELISNVTEILHDFLFILGFGGGKYISFEDRQWHQPCFMCSRCSVTLVGAGFFPEQDEILCRSCNSNL